MMNTENFQPVTIPGESTLSQQLAAHHIETRRKAEMTLKWVAISVFPTAIVAGLAGRGIFSESEITIIDTLLTAFWVAGGVAVVGGLVWVGFKLWDAVSWRRREARDKELSVQEELDAIAYSRAYNTLQLEREKFIQVYPDDHGLLGVAINILTGEMTDLDNLTDGMRESIGRQRQLAALTGAVIPFQAVQKIVGNETKPTALQSNITMVPQSDTSKTIEV